MRGPTRLHFRLHPFQPRKLICLRRRHLEATNVPDILEKSHTLLKDASQWYNSHLLKLNVQKTQFCVFSNRNLSDYYHLNFQNTKIESQLSINVLGVALDTDLSIHTHATDVGTKANKLVYFISKLKKNL